MFSPGKARLDLDIRGRARRRVKPALARELCRLVRRGLRAAGEEKRALTLSLTDDAELLALNTKYAGEDHATDVLSFEQEPPLLGDVVISVETAARQAREHELELIDELVHLTLHGIAHLQGWDHAERDEEVQMLDYVARLMQVTYESGVPRRVSRRGLSWPRRRRA